MTACYDHPPTEPRDEEYRLHYRAHELEPDEVVVDIWTASRSAGVKLLGGGGKLVLTTKRLLFEPMRTPKDALLGPLAELAGLGQVGSFIKSGINATGSLEQWGVPLSSIARVDPFGTDQLQVTMRSGETWKFGISAGLYALPGSSETTAQRDDAVTKIQRQLGGGLPVPPPRAPTVAAAPVPARPEEPFELRVAKARLLARTSNRPQMLDQEGPMRLYVAPDGLLHVSIGYPPDRAPGATQPAELVGTWRYEGAERDDEFIVLDADGSASGYVWLFGALPPLPLAGQWWYDAATSRVTPAVQVFGPPGLLDDTHATIFESGLPLHLKSVGRDVVVAGIVDPDSGRMEEFTFHRAARGGS